MVADQLRILGVDVRFSSFGEAASYILMRGYQCATVPPVEFAWSMEGGFSVKHSLANIPTWIANFSRQVNEEARNMTLFHPDVVISDSRMSPLVAARLIGIPAVVILNQVKLLLSPRLREFAISRFFEDLVGEFLGSMWSLADRVMIPDLPAPNTLSESNVWDIGSAADKIEYVGFMSPKPHVPPNDVDKVADMLGFSRSRPIIFVHVSGPAQTRMRLVRLSLAALRKLGPKTQFVISEGNTKGDVIPRKVGDLGWYYEWCPVKDELFAMSDILVVRGGHVALSQAIQFGKPVVVVPIENHGEQLGNSAKIARLGMGTMLHPKGLAPEQLADAICDVLGNNQYAAKAQELRTFAETLNGIDNIVKIIRSYL